jgi:signal-transduction protein with cAMP-binding, CBS, and nucleotidyltransferase domain
MDHEIQQRIDAIMANMVTMRRSLKTLSDAYEQTAITMVRLQAQLKEKEQN